jgi:hypothetical protein
MKRHASLLLLVPCMLAIGACWTACEREKAAEQPAAKSPVAKQPAAKEPAAEKPAIAQETYASPEDAVVRLIDTVRKADVDLLVPIFGPQIADMSADTKERTEGDLQRLAAAYDRKHSLVKEDDGSVTLLVGENDWDFPAPIIQENGRWKFDTVAGVKEIRARRIDRNETDAASTCGALVAVQQQYFAMSAARGESTPAYAPRIRSTPGKRDGLYWDDAMGQPLSPLGPMVAQAVEAGDLKAAQVAQAAPGPQPYRGYMFRVLTRQGKGAPGGEKNYVDAGGRMTGGYAFLAWPAVYGETGLMTFQVSADGVVYQKDLGAGTADAAKALEAFDPAGWEKSAP